MAQADLLALLQEFQGKLTEKDGGIKFRVKVPDIWEHRLIVSKPDIIRELRIQLAELSLPGRTKGQKLLSTRASQLHEGQEAQEAFLSQQGLEFNEKDLTYLADFFINNLYNHLVRDPPKGYLVNIKKINGLTVIFVADPNSVADKDSFLVKVGKRGRIFDKLSSSFALARMALNRQIAIKFGKKVSVQATEVTFEVGHVVAVAQLRAGEVLAAMSSKEINAVLGTLEFTGLSELVRKNTELVKKFENKITYVKPQSAVANNLASKHDANILKQVRSAVEKTVSEMLVKDWASQSGSNSLIDGIVAELIEVAVKNKAKVRGATAKKDFSKSKAKAKPTDIVGKTTSINMKASMGDVTSNLKIETSGSTTSLRSLIPVLNERLPEIVRRNMGQAGRLVNRTGRFAESSEIVDIGDNMLISYTYMKQPYQTFESQGKRDPRPLIEQSIRELARGLISQRFNLRRV